MAIIEIPDAPVDDQGRMTLRHTHGSELQIPTAYYELTLCGLLINPQIVHPAPKDAPWCEECLALDG